MARELKDSKMASFKLRTDILRMLDEYSKETGITKTRIIEDALVKVFAEK